MHQSLDSNGPRPEEKRVKLPAQPAPWERARADSGREAFDRWLERQRLFAGRLEARLTARARALEKAGGVERRVSPRFAARGARVRAGWRRPGTSRLQVHPAALANISAGGALLIAADRPRPGQVLWLRLNRPRAAGSVAATVLDVVDRHDATFAIRVKFRGPCLRAFLRAAALGPEAGATGEGPGA